MNTEHAVAPAGERATIERTSSGRPTPKYIEAMRDLLEGLQRSATRCESCRTGVASVVRGHPPVVICRTCAATYGWSPLEQRRLRLQIARTR